MVRKDAIKVSLEQIGSNSCLPKKILNRSPGSETAQNIIQHWIEAATEQVFTSSFLESLKDGVLLCKLVKRIEPGRLQDQDVVELQPNSTEALQNLKNFLSGCLSFGLCEWQLFDPEELQKAAIDNKLSTSQDDIVHKLIGTLYWLGCTIQNMSYYKGPKLDISRFERNKDGVIAVKQNGNVPHNDLKNLSLMYGGEVDSDSTEQLNGTLPSRMGVVPDYLMNGYEDNVRLTMEQPIEFSVNVRIVGEEKRFGFSVMGGADEGFTPRIDNIAKGSPAERANLRIGDDILEVNGESVRNSSHTEVILAIHKCLKNRVIALKILRGGDTVRGGFSTFVDPLDRNGTEDVDPVTQEKIKSIIKDQENDPQFEYYNSDAETDSVQSFNHDQLDSPSNLRPSASWVSESTDAKNSSSLGGFYSKDVLQSNLQKNKSLSTAVFDLSKLDSIDDEGQPEWSLHNNGYETDSNTSAAPSRVQSVSPTGARSASPSRPEPDSLTRPKSTSPSPPLTSPTTSQAITGFACIDEVKPMLITRNEQDNLSSVEQFLGNRDVQNATKIYGKIIDFKRARKGPGFSRPESTNSQYISTQISASVKLDMGSSDEQELIHLLNSPDFQNLLLVHDRLAFREVLPDDDDEDEEQELSRQPSIDDQSSLVEDDSVKIVRIDKSSDPLGATVKNEDGAVLIGRIVKGGAAEKSGLLHEGDEILEINGVNMKGKTVSEVCELLADMNGTLTFLLIPSKRSVGTLTSQREVHVKANFDYDPYDDEYIPCRELGLAFRRGDILHVVNQDDANWWQAWRAGEEGMKLAGLIPSKHFQQQRESLKHTIPVDNPSTTNEKKRCLCIKKKRRKKVVYNAQHNEVLEVDQVLTYDEVALLYPNASRKRPVVLIGPTRIGRKEIRQRLIQFSPDRYAGAIPHTSRQMKPGEVNGRDYFFVPRHTFMGDIVAHKYVEHGELQDHYYGTSFEAIKMVINAGKVCILNLHCEALKTLRASDIKPYVVFIFPPSFEGIKASRRGKVDPFNPKLKEPLSDKELHEMIERGREMEESFGHYFDYKIANTDLERTFDELRQVIDRLETEPRWVPVSWVR